MITEPLIHYIREQLAMGVAKDAIVEALISHGGWEHADIDEAFGSIGSVPLRVTHVHSHTYHHAVRYVGFPARVLASCIDAIAAAVFTIGIVWMFIDVSMFTTQRTVLAVYVYVYFFVSLLYFSISTFVKGKTLGKKVIGAIVVSDTFEPLSLEKVIVRECTNRILSFVTICIAYAFVAFSEKKQGIHDSLVKSVVIYEDPSQASKKERQSYIVIASLFFGIVAVGAFGVLVTFFAARRAESYHQQQKALLQRIMVAANQYQQSQQSYGYAKNCISGMFLDPTIQPLILSLKEPVACMSSGNSYALSVPAYKKNASLCIDSTAQPVRFGTATQRDSVGEEGVSIAECQ